MIVWQMHSFHKMLSIVIDVLATVWCATLNKFKVIFVWNIGWKVPKRKRHGLQKPCGRVNKEVETQREVRLTSEEQRIYLNNFHIEENQYHIGTCFLNALVTRPRKIWEFIFSFLEHSCVLKIVHNFFDVVPLDLYALGSSIPPPPPLSTTSR